MIPACIRTNRGRLCARLTLALLATPLLGASSPALAALPPTEQRVREIEAVARAAASLLGNPIEGVQYVEPDRFRAQAGNCHVEVRIVPVAARNSTVPPPGPARFTAVPGQVTCRQQ